MTPRSYKIEGIILSRFNYKEADRVLTIFTKKRGKIKVLARSVRKISSKRAGQVEVFNQIKAQIHRGKGWDIVGELEQLTSFKQLRDDLVKIVIAWEAVELVDRLSVVEDPNETVYHFLFRSLQKLNQSGKVAKDFLNYFKIKLLSLIGFWPEDKKMAKSQLDPFIEELIHSKIKSKEIRL